MAKFKIRFKEKAIFRDEKGEVIDRETVGGWTETIEASTVMQALNIAGEKAERIMKEDPDTEITYEAEIPIGPSM